MTTPQPLTEADFEVLEFARVGWASEGRREQTIRDRWVVGGQVTWRQHLDRILDHPDAEAYDPTLVRRLRRVRDGWKAMRRDPEALMGEAVVVTLIRKTALARRAELKRTELARGKKALARTTAMKRTVAKQRRQRDTGPTFATKEALWIRAEFRCELCGRHLNPSTPFSRHHRRPRGMGGSRVEWINDLTNLLLVCGSATSPDGCHHLIESQRALALVNGWLVPAGYHPAEVPALLHHHDDPLYLTADGQYAEGSA